MRLVEVIQKYLDKNNHNWNWLVEESGLPRSIVYDIKSKKRDNITLRNLLKIDKALDIDLNDLKTGGRNENK